MGGVVKAIKSVVDVVAPFAQFIPGVGQLVGAMKMGLDIADSVMNGADQMAFQKKMDQKLQEKISFAKTMAFKDFAMADAI